MSGFLAVLVTVLYLAAVNGWSAALAWWDKRQAARGGRRVRERTLHLLALAGGFAGGAWAMRRLRHKTAKRSFAWRYALAGAGHVARPWAAALWLAA